jgi:hypothetical protein
MHLMRVIVFGVLALAAAQAPRQPPAVRPERMGRLLADKGLKEWTRVPLGAVGH